MARQRVLVTGSSGFVGAAVARQLVARGREVALMLRETSDTRRIADILNRVTVIRTDLSTVSAATAEIALFRPEAVAHLAWAGVKGADRNSPVQTNNISAAVALYQAARAAGCARFVGLGSQAEYGPRPGRSDENVPTQPTTLYGAAKLSTFWLLDRLAAADGASSAWLRLFSSYGPGDDPSWMIPYLINKLLKGERPSLTLCEQRWDYIYIDDAAASVVALIDCDGTGAFNLGSGEAVPLREVVETIRDLVDPALPLGFGEVLYRPDQVMHLEANIDRLREAAGWAPKVSLAEGLARTVAYYRSAALAR